MNVARSTQNVERHRLWFLWCLLIVVIVVPWYDFQDHLHWGNVAWRPFIDPPWRLLDVVLNTLLYVPLGRALARERPSWQAVAFAGALSVLTEGTQLFSHSRVPSLTDVTSNVAGAWVGTLFVVRKPQPSLPLEISS